jgi:two-component system chemotaxis response regulator CheB
MGSSTGGLQALFTVLPALPSDFPVPVVIVQHVLPTADDYLARSLKKKCRVTVKQADEKETPLPGVVYIAPPNYHLMIEIDRTLSLSTDEPINDARPAIDVLFETAAEAHESRLIGVMLTGTSSDGSRGLKEVKTRGGLTLVQDPATADAQPMPRAAPVATEVDWLAPLEEIGLLLCELCMGRRRESGT